MALLAWAAAPAAGAAVLAGQRRALPDASEAALSIPTLTFLWWGLAEVGLHHDIAGAALPVSWLAWRHARGPEAWSGLLGPAGALHLVASAMAGVAVALAASSPATAVAAIAAALAALALAAPNEKGEDPLSAALGALPTGIVLAGTAAAAGAAAPVWIGSGPAMMAWAMRGRGVAAAVPAALVGAALAWLARSGPVSGPWVTIEARWLWLSLLGLLAAAVAALPLVLARSRSA